MQFCQYCFDVSFSKPPTGLASSDLLGHADVAHPWPSSVLGAGFCYINDDKEYVCYGESVSLKVKSRGDEDSAILNKFLGVTYDDY